MKLIIDKNPESRLCSFIAAVVFCIFLTNISAGLSYSLGIDFSYVSTLLKVLLGIMFVLRVEIIAKRFNKHLFFYVVISFLVILINYLLFPDLNRFFKNTVLSFLTFCMTTYLICYSITDFELLKRQLTRISFAISAMTILFLIGVFSGKILSFNDNRYSMGLGYSCTIPAIILTIDAVQKKRMVSIISVIALSVTIVSFGSRGPIIELILFAAFFSVRYLFNKRKYFQSALILLVITVTLLFYKNLLSFFSLLLQRSGIQSRVIRVLTTQTLYLSGRDTFYEILIPIIRDNPFAIRGINAEWDILGIYAHNFIIELLYQFGIVLGTAIVMLIIVRMVKTLFIKEIDVSGILCLMFMFASIPQLFVSGSLWTSYTFWLWMAIYSKIMTTKQYIGKYDLELRRI